MSVRQAVASISRRSPPTGKGTGPRGSRARLLAGAELSLGEAVRRALYQCDRAGPVGDEQHGAQRGELLVVAELVALELYALDPAFLEAAAAKLERNNRWDISVTGGSLYLTIGEAALESEVRRVTTGE